MTKLLSKAVIVISALALFGASPLGAEEKKKDTAKKQLEAAAGKKVEDVKVPEPPKPTPVEPAKKK